jgi:hypothetical protein
MFQIDFASMHIGAAYDAAHTDRNLLVNGGSTMR